MSRIKPCPICGAPMTRTKAQAGWRGPLLEMWRCGGCQHWEPYVPPEEVVDADEEDEA